MKNSPKMINIELQNNKNYTKVTLHRSACLESARVKDLSRFWCVHGDHSQGLPINFIVLIAIGVLVLILVTMFLLGGAQQTSSVNSQAAYNACNSKCSAEIQYFQMSGAADHDSSPFCTGSYNIAGLGSKQCHELVSCKATDNCLLTCIGTKAKCL